VTVSFVWFWVLLDLAALSLMLGRMAGRLNQPLVRIAASLGFALVALAAAPKFHPTLLHQALSLHYSIWLEGVLAVFPWMFLVGVLWTSEFGQSHQRTAVLLVILGGAYYLFGGVWMVLPDVVPSEHEIRTGDGDSLEDGVTLQSRPDTCVPAACATALRRMGIPATELEMCSVVMARPGRGSTLARAAYGLSEYLDRRGIRVSIQGFDALVIAHLAQPSRPILVTIRSNLAMDHMVVVMGRVGSGVIIANPSPGNHANVSPMNIQTNPGYEMYTLKDFEQLYRGAAIVFESDEF